MQVILGLMLAEGLACVCFAKVVKQTMARLPAGLLRLAGAIEAGVALLLWVLATS